MPACWLPCGTLALKQLLSMQIVFMRQRELVWPHVGLRQSLWLSWPLMVVMP